MDNLEEMQIEEMEKHDNSIFKLGTVTGFFDDGCPKIMFYGEDAESKKKYSYISTYSPCINDNILLCEVNGTTIILGSLRFNQQPSKSIEDITETLQDVVKLNQNGVIENMNDEHYNRFYALETTRVFKQSGRAGFFGNNPVSKTKVGFLTNYSDLSTLSKAFVNLCKALNSYGLI